MPSVSSQKVNRGRLDIVRQWCQIAEEYFWCKNVRWSDNDFPIFYSSCDFVCTPHFRVAQTANDEYNQTRDIFYGRLGFVLVPLTVARSVQCNLKRFFAIWIKENYSWIVQQWVWVLTFGACCMKRFGRVQPKMENVEHLICRRCNLPWCPWWRVSSGTTDKFVRSHDSSAERYNSCFDGPVKNKAMSDGSLKLIHSKITSVTQLTPK